VQLQRALASATRHPLQLQQLSKHVTPRCVWRLLERVGGASQRREGLGGVGEAQEELMHKRALPDSGIALDEDDHRAFCRPFAAP
jgi:hypothetical protein